MAAFHYEALDASGAVSSGVIEADTARQARSRLRARGLVPAAVEALDARERARAGSRVRVRTGELALLTRQMASLLQSGLTVERTLSALADEAAARATREVLVGVKGAVMNGASLAAALAGYPRTFPELYRSLVRAGEQSGALPTVLEHLADHLEAREALRQKTTLALLYPALVTTFAVLIVAGLLAYVVPQVIEVFRHARQALPLMTRALIALSDFVRGAGLPLIAIAAVGALAARPLMRREGVRTRRDALALRVPVLGALLRSSQCARFASTVSILLRGGVPLLSALESAAGSISNTVLRSGAREAMARVRDGSSLAAALAAARTFPPMLVHLAASGEATGNLPEMLERAARLESDAFERRLGWLVALLEPALIVAMGVLVLFVVLAILVPIVSLNQLVR